MWQILKPSDPCIIKQEEYTCSSHDLRTWEQYTLWLYIKWLFKWNLRYINIKIYLFIYLCKWILFVRDQLCQAFPVFSVLFRELLGESCACIPLRLMGEWGRGKKKKKHSKNVASQCRFLQSRTIFSNYGPPWISHRSISRYAENSRQRLPVQVQWDGTIPSYYFYSIHPCRTLEPLLM